MLNKFTIRYLFLIVIHNEQRTYFNKLSMGYIEKIYDLIRIYISESTSDYNVSQESTRSYTCYSTNWNPGGSRILLVQIGILIFTSRNWNSDLYWI